ncbi:MAG TPA: propionyl-CoA synthetase, partial [Candidatus Lustribacter sp.]|nr:propionyl-CoA synthetase [Candidatus Lustribacter sp.]
VLNIAGHRLSTGSIEEALAGHPAVAECAVIGVHDDLKGQLPRALVVLKSGIDAKTDGVRICTELVARVRSEVGAVAALRQVDIVAALPKTRSGKILRKTMREIADGHTPSVPGTIEDASVLVTLTPVLLSH